MSKHTLHIVLSARDQATRPLREVQRAINDTGKAVRKTNADIIQFNRVMFSTSAFIWLFQKKTQALFETLQEGANLDRLETQFEAVLGPKGNLFAAISALTSASIDKFEAMRAGIALKTLGVANTTEDLAEIITGAGVAAKRAGLNSGEGIKKVTEALKDGNLSHLEFLNLIRTNDAGLKAQLSILGKYTGVLGQAVTAQQKHALILSIIRSVARSAKNETRDLQDVLADLGQGFKFASAEGGRFLGTALSPVIDKVTEVVQVMTDLAVKMRGSKELLFLAKSFMVVTSAAALFFGTLYTGKMALMAMSSLGVGFPLLTAAIIGTVMAFKAMTDKTAGVFNKFKLFGAVVKGIYELVSNFDEKSGISKISSDIEKLLSEQGLMGFVKNAARGIIAVKTYLSEMGNLIKDIFLDADNAISKTIRKIIDFIGATDKPWARKWIDSTKPAYQMLVKFGLAALGIAGAFKVLKGLGGIGGALSKLPLIGRFFGNSGKPDGSQSRPFYTKSLDAISSKIGGFISTQKDETFEAFKNLANLFGITAFIEGLKNAGKAALLFAARIAVSAVAGAAIGALLAELILLAAGVENVRKAFDATVGKMLGMAPTAEANKAQERAKLNTPEAMGIYDQYRKQGIFLSGQEILDRINSKTGVAQSPGTLGIERTTKGLDAATGRNLTSIPAMPDTEKQKMSLITEDLQYVDESKRDLMMEALQEAQKGTSAGAESITQEEWVSIFRIALNTSQLNEHAAATSEQVKEANNKKDAKLISTKRGC
jgi:hypothetical protein